MRSQLKDAIDAYLKRCFRTQSPPRVSEVAALLKISRDTLATRFRATYGITVREYIRAAQIACAERLLHTTTLAIAAIAATTGYSSERSFRRAFIKATGRSPSSARRPNAPQ